MPEIDTVHFYYDIVDYVEKGYDKVLLIST